MSVRNLQLGPSELDDLARGAERLGANLDPEVLQGFGTYANLIDQWSRRINLVSCGSSAELVARHLLDSLTAVPWIPTGSRIIDLGSGAGLPGIPLALTRPDLQVSLLESRSRRVAFLRTARRALNLTNVEIHEGRAEVIPYGEAASYDVAMCRAVWPPAEASTKGSTWLRPGGRMLIFTGASFPVQRTGVGMYPDFRVVDHENGPVGNGRLLVLEVI